MRNILPETQACDAVCTSCGRWYDLCEAAPRFLAEAEIGDPAGAPLALAAGEGWLALGCSGCICTLPLTASHAPEVHLASYLTLALGKAASDTQPQTTPSPGVLLWAPRQADCAGPSYF